MVLRSARWVGVGALALLFVPGGPPGARAGTWVGHNDGLRNLTVNGIGIASSSANTIYIQARALGVYKSTDGGATWNKTATFNNDNGPGYDHLIHNGPAVHPTNPDVAWVASGGRVYKTANGGSSWSLSSTGTTVNGCNGVHGVVIDPNDPDHLFAGTIVAGCDGGVFESADGGANWTNIAGSNVPGSSIGNDAWPLALDASATSRLYSGSPHNAVYRSIDGGHTWLSTPPVGGDHSTYEVVINPLSPDEVWCREVGGTWVSTDYGATWTRQTHLFNDREIYALRFAPSDPQIAYAIVGDTIWRSSDNGVSWAARADVLGGPRCIEIDPANPDVVYIGTWGLGMYKSTDGAQTVSEINTGLPMTSLIVGSQAFGDPLEPGGRYCVLGGNVMYHLDAGQTEWQYYGVAPDDYILIERHRPERWYCASGGLWRSLDSGLTWDQVYTEGSATSVIDLWLDPRQCGRILLIDGNGDKVVMSMDGGEVWSSLGPVPIADGWISGVSGDPFDPQTILIAAGPPYHSGSQHGYIWRTTNLGATWEHVRDGMFYGDWRIGNGYWKVLAGVMRQEQPCCGNYHVNLDHQTFGDGTYECRMRILDSNEGNTQYWAGFLVRTATADTNFVDSGWLVFMRRNGVVALFNALDGTVINASETPIVADTSQWNTITLVATGNYYELHVNGSLVGTYTDANHRYDNPGYFALQTNRTLSEFDNLSITAETSHADTFDPNLVFAAAWGRWLAADPHNPGRFALSTQWGGFWHTQDHGATWQRISGDDRAGYLYYRPLYSTLHDGNLYVSSGYSYSWRIDNFHDDGASRQQLGQNLSYSTITLSEDPFDAQTLHACVYDLGITAYEGGGIIGETGPPIPVRIDFDKDGDIDQADFGHLQACFSGPGIAQNESACADARLDDDDDVDPADLSLFLSCMTSANIPPDPACDCEGQ